MRTRCIALSFLLVMAADVIGQAPPAPPPPPLPGTVPPTVTATASWDPPQRLRGVTVRGPQRISLPNPTYPPAAAAARIRGLVMLQAFIGADGRVTDIRVSRSIPALDQAAIDAVRQWQFTPTLVNGKPMATVMTVSVLFAMT